MAELCCKDRTNLVFPNWYTTKFSEMISTNIRAHPQLYLNLEQVGVYVDYN